jgi:hypothetical protein
MAWTLIIHQELDMAHLAAQALDQLANPDIQFATTLEQANERLMDHGTKSCSLIIADAAVRADGEQVGAVAAPAGPAVTRFFEDIHRRNPKTRCIALITVGADKRLAPLAELDYVEQAYFSTLRKVLDQNRQPANKRRHDVDVDIIISGTVGEWRIRGAQDPRVRSMGCINISNRNMRRLLNDSQRAHCANHQSMCQLGQDMYEFLLMAEAGSSKLELELAKCTLPPGSLESVRFRFQVNQHSNPLLVETIAKPVSDQDTNDLDLWMLHTPIFRNFEGTSTRHALFKDRLSRQEPLRCLIIEGETGDFSVGGAVAKHFDPLKYAADELSWLTRHFQSSFNFDVAPPTFVQFERGEPRAPKLRQLLARPGPHWHLIHYLGHTTFGDDEKGYLVLGGGTEDLMPVDEFGELAANSQFVFLNSCQSADARFITSLIKHNIPAIAGYAWRIDDKAAYKFCRKFYESLFAGTVSQRFLEYAFMNARAHLHESAKGRSSVWAAPLLFMHGREAEPD